MMLDIFRKTFLLGLGLTSLTREKAEEFIDELIKRGEVESKEKGKAVDDLIQKAKEEEKKFNEKLNDAVQNVISNMGITTKKDIEILENKIKDLENIINEKLK
jgi:polyhydroxyalkanoate synthesis regulator phasin